MILCIAAGRKLICRCLPSGTLEVLWLMAAARLWLPPDIGIAAAFPYSRGIFTGSVPAGLRQLRWAGFGILLFVTAGSYIRFYKGLGDRKVMDSALIKGWRRKYFHGQGCPVYRSRSVASPLAYGLFFPAIVLPEQEYNCLELEMILLHEWMHIHRGDLWKKAFMMMTLLLNWYNPACWLMAVLFAREIELDCDAGALSLLPRVQRAVYARVLLDSYSKMSRRAAAAAGWLDGGLQERIYKIMKQKKYQTRQKAVLLPLRVSSFSQHLQKLTDAGQCRILEAGQSRKRRGYWRDIILGIPWLTVRQPTEGRAEITVFEKYHDLRGSVVFFVICILPFALKKCFIKKLIFWIDKMILK